MSRRRAIREYAEVGIQQFGLDVRIEYLEALQLPAASFDIVTLYDVVEHVPDPCVLLQEVRRILKPDGLVLQSPNLGSVMADFCRGNGPGCSPLTICSTSRHQPLLHWQKSPASVIGTADLGAD